MFLLLLRPTAILLLTTTATSSPLIQIQNTTPSPICYTVESTTGTLPVDPTADCPGFIVSANQTITRNPSPDFRGAITAHRSLKKRGARHELSFDADRTWYNIDYEMGMSDSTLGPLDQRLQVDNTDSLAGESDCLAKANAAWEGTSNKDELLGFPKYLKQGGDERLTHVHMDKEAPSVVRHFFQVTADFGGYVVPGTAFAQKFGGEMADNADEKSWEVDTQEMEIVAY